MASPDQLVDTDSAQLPSPSSATASAQQAGVSKRYRPAPAKTFQCRGYGECRMVFSRSEHLARHIRKHTGERPFSCHCGKQFSRLDNLRQHAQTVHADKQELNERMMRELSSLHASMASTNKPTSGGRTAARRGQQAQQLQQSQLQPAPDSPNQEEPSMQLVKQEDQFSGLTAAHRRPGTSTGYEGDLYPGTNPAWHIHSGNNSNTPSPPSAHDNNPGSNHSFRDSSQSFRAQQPDSASSRPNSNGYYHHVDQSQSFLPFSSTLNFSVTDPRSYQQQQLHHGHQQSRHQQQQQQQQPPSHSPSAAARSSQPPSAAALPSPSDVAGRSLPPLSAVVSSSASVTQLQSPGQQPFPSPTSSFFRRPSTSSARPGTAPASFFYQSSANVGRELPNGLSVLGGLGGPNAYQYSHAAYQQQQQQQQQYYGQEPTSPGGLNSSGSYESPFSFHPPPASQQPATASGISTVPQASRKRPLPDEFDGNSTAEQRPGTAGGYDYGSDSRPQSRRLTVMELCNDGDPGSRPGTATNPPPSSSSGAFPGGKEQSFAFDLRHHANANDVARGILPVRGQQQQQQGSAEYATTASPTSATGEKSERGSQARATTFFWNGGLGSGDRPPEECDGQDDGGAESSPFAFGYGSDGQHVPSSAASSGPAAAEADRLSAGSPGDAASTLHEPLFSAASTTATGAARSPGFGRPPSSAVPNGQSPSAGAAFVPVHGGYGQLGSGHGVPSSDRLSPSSASSSVVGSPVLPPSASPYASSGGEQQYQHRQRLLSPQQSPLSSSPTSAFSTASAPASRPRLSSGSQQYGGSSVISSSPYAPSAAAGTAPFSTSQSPPAYVVRSGSAASVRDGLGGGGGGASSPSVGHARIHQHHHHVIRRDGPDAWVAGGSDASSARRTAGSGGGVQVARMRV